jgi:hypothetical protein
MHWSNVGYLFEDEYYVVRIPYDAAGNAGEFWRKETSFRVPSNYSLSSVGFPDRHYHWTVQVMRCTQNCAAIGDDNARKGGQAVSDRSAEGLFFWHSDRGGRATFTPPANQKAPTATPPP